MDYKAVVVPAGPDHYATLEVSPQASIPVIDATFNVLMKKYGPEGVSPDEVLSAQIVAAYQTISDPKRRSKYDAERTSLEGKIVGEFRVLRKIAEGGIGVTYLGEHVLTGMPVCLKHCTKTSAAFRNTLVNEAKAMWDLRHFAIPAVRSVIQLEDSKGRPSIMLVMSYIEGPTLAQIVEKVGRMDPEHVAWIAERVLNALMYMHERKVMHGDLKPQNIIIQPKTHTLVIVDFGLAMIRPISGSGSIGYTEGYAPPEQIAGQKLSPASDFYSLGMTMLYALCGGDEDDFKGLRVPRSTPEPLQEFVSQLIVRDPENRPQDTLELHNQISEVREKSFGRRRSGMKPIPGLDDEEETE